MLWEKFHMSGCQQISTWVLVTVAAGLLSGCVVRQTVTSGGEVIKDGYVVKRPLKNAIVGAE